MIVFRLLSLAFWVLAALALAGDLWAMMEKDEFVPTALGRRWADVNLESLTTAQNFVERYISPELWNPGIVTVLSWPAWAVLGGSRSSARCSAGDADGAVAGACNRTRATPL